VVEQFPGTFSKQILEIQLSVEDARLLDECRGDLPPEVFLIALLRLAGRGRVSGSPVWIKKSDAERIS
jgi:hypothetical protein